MDWKLWEFYKWKGRGMNGILVVYSSKYGYTEKYAQWLAEALNGDICKAKNLNRKTLDDYSIILFGSGLYAGTNKAARLIATHWEKIKNKKLVLFTCGLADVSKDANILEINNALDKVITPEIRKTVKIFHVRGGIDYHRLTFLHKMMMKMPYFQIRKKPESEWTDEDLEFLAAYGKKVDFSDKKMLDSIIAYCIQVQNSKQNHNDVE